LGHDYNNGVIVSSKYLPVYLIYLYYISSYSSRALHNALTRLATCQTFRRRWPSHRHRHHYYVYNIIAAAVKVFFFFLQFSVCRTGTLIRRSVLRVYVHIGMIRITGTVKTNLHILWYYASRVFLRFSVIIYITY